MHMINGMCKFRWARANNSTVATTDPKFNVVHEQEVVAQSPMVTHSYVALYSLLL